MSRVILWDFDETLAHRPGKWRGAMVAALDALCPGHGMTADTIGPRLRSGYPWHRPHEPHPELCDGAAWWARMEAIMARVFVDVGAPPALAPALARLAHERYVDAASYRLYDDTLPALRRLSDAGWRHVIVTNHVPELPAIAEALGLSSHVADVVCSAATGYEKPHPEAFSIARRRAGNPSLLWMIGNSYSSDVLGAEACGIPAILVRSSHPAAKRTAPDLVSAADLLLSADRARGGPVLPEV